MLDVGEYKHKLILNILSCKDIVKAIDSQSEKYNPDQPDSLLMVNIFPHIHIPNLQDVTETYIMLACDVPSINSYNPTFHNVRLTIRIMAHKDRLYMKGENNTRIDYIANKVIARLEDSSNFGFGVLRLISNREIILNENYLYREITFKTCDIAKRCC